MANAFIQEARETGALKEAKENLEKEVEDLVAKLQMEKHKRVFNWFETLYIYNQP